MAERSPFSMRVVRSDGQEMSFGDGTQWVLSINGMEDWIALDYDVTTSENVLSDGSYVVGKRVQEKDRTMSAVYWGIDRLRARNSAISFFNPKFSFEAYVTYFGRTRWCEGEQIGFDCPMVTENTPTKITWTLLCPDPYLRSEYGNEESLTDSKPMFGFPFVSHVQEVPPDGVKKPVGFNASITIYDGKNTVYNNGDVPTYYKIRCKCKGQIQNPMFLKDGKFIRMLDTYNAGDVIEIDFTAAPPTVTVNGVNSIQSCSRDSNFAGMIMQTGGNIFTYKCDNEENRIYMEVQILFNRKYLGM